MKHIKNVLALLLAAFLLMGLCACGKTAETQKEESSAPTLPPVPTVTPAPTPEPEPSLAGYYMMTGITQEGELIESAPAEDDSVVQFNIYLVLEEDGNGYLDMFGVQTPVKWDESSIFVEDEETGESGSIPLSRDGDKLVLEQDGEKMIFTLLTEEQLADYKENGSGSLEDLFSISTFDYPEGDPTEGTVSGTIGDAYVTILSAEQFVDDDGDDAIRFWYEYTNQSEELSSANHALFFDAWQDGEDLQYCWTYDTSVPEDDYAYLEVIPGKTIRCTETKKFNPDGGVVGFRIYDLWDDSSALYYYADPADLPGAPEDEFVIEVTGELPDILEDLETENDEVLLDSFEVTADSDGNDLIRIYFVFFNNSGAETNCMMNHSIKVFQDGVELESGYPDDYVDEDFNYYKDIPDGESIDCAECYLLRSDSPVAVIIVNDETDEMIGGVADLEP